MRKYVFAGIAVAAMLASTSPAFATFVCKEIVKDGGTEVIDIYGNVTRQVPVGVRSVNYPEVFYGDVGCGPAGTCVMPSLVGPNEEVIFDYKVFWEKIGEQINDLPDEYKHKWGVLDWKDTAHASLWASLVATKKQYHETGEWDWVHVYVPVYNYGRPRDGECPSYGGGGG